MQTSKTMESRACSHPGAITASSAPWTSSLPENSVSGKGCSRGVCVTRRAGLGQRFQPGRKQSGPSLSALCEKGASKEKQDNRNQVPSIQSHKAGPTHWAPEPSQAALETAGSQSESCRPGPPPAPLLACFISTPSFRFFCF